MLRTESWLAHFEVGCHFQSSCGGILDYFKAICSFHIRIQVHMCMLLEVEIAAAWRRASEPSFSLQKSTKRVSWTSLGEDHMYIIRDPLAGNKTLHFNSV